MRTEAPLLAPLFRSAGQARLLAVVLLSGDELGIPLIAERADLAYPTAHREVSRLADAGILVTRQVGRSLQVRANPDSPLTAPLREILAVATGPAVLLEQALSAVTGVESAFLYGSFAARMRGIDGPAPNDIDLMVVGDVDAGEVYRICNEVEPTVGRPVNPTILTSSEIAQSSGFVESLKANPVVLLVGDLPW